MFIYSSLITFAGLLIIFYYRQEAQERTRRTELDLAIGKAAYDKIIDKKQCPVCTAKQSYDEVKEKRKGKRKSLSICYSFLNFLRLCL